MIFNKRDVYTYEGANILAYRIREYWKNYAENFYPPRVVVVPIEGTRRMFRVSSDMVDGLPIRRYQS